MTLKEDLEVEIILKTDDKERLEWKIFPVEKEGLQRSRSRLKKGRSQERPSVVTPIANRSSTFQHIE
jgi:hypothetical protein